MGTLEEVLVDNLVGSLFLTSKDTIAHLLQMRFGCRTIIVMGRAAPERFLIEL